MDSPAILARGHWPAERVRARWLEQHYEPPEDYSEAADAAITALRERGSPAMTGCPRGSSRMPRQGDELVLEPLQRRRRCARPRRCVDFDGGVGVDARRELPLARGPPRCRGLVVLARTLGARRRGRRRIRESRSTCSPASCARSGRSRPSASAARPSCGFPTLVMFVGLAWLPEGAEIQRDDEDATMPGVRPTSRVARRGRRAAARMATLLAGEELSACLMFGRL